MLLDERQTKEKRMEGRLKRKKEKLNEGRRKRDLKDLKFSDFCIITRRKVAWNRRLVATFKGQDVQEELNFLTIEGGTDR